jgi:amino acid adenylation domain-containing protein/non-ribosomal peptide synthase protein (TIGR01720 family)
MWNIGGALKVKSKLSFDLAEEAINILIKKNEAFRLAFKEENGGFYQYIKDYEKIQIDRYSFCSFQQFANWADEDFKEGFSIGREKLFYFALCSVNKSENYVYLKMHHIISDGWSFSIIVKELCDIYNNLLEGRELKDSCENSYLDFIKAEEEYLNSGRFKKDKEYWNDKFSILPDQLYNDKDNKVQGKRKAFILDKKLSQNIYKILQEYKLSLNTIFISAYLIYVFKMFDQEDVVIGNPNFNRTSRRERKTIGMFTSSMPFRYRLYKDEAINELIDGVNNELLKCFRHQKYPYNLLIQDLKIGQLGYDSLFNVCINYYNGDFKILMNGETVEVLEFYNGYQAYPLQIVVKELREREVIELDFDYKLDAHSEEGIEILYEYVIKILCNILENPNEKIDNIKLLPKEQISRLQFDFNSSQSNYPIDKTIFQIFEEQVEKTPNNIAISFNSVELTYDELNCKANQLARKLRERGVKTQSKVAIMAAHSCEMVIAILAIIKAGAAYVPIDGNYPAERIEYMISDSGVSLILTNYKINHDISFKGEYINLNNSNLYTGDTSNLTNISTAKDLVYIIYTSGSTGKPKGVMIEHRGLVNYSFWARKVYIKSQEEIFALYSSLSFDLTVTSIFVPLISGNRIEIYHDDGSEFILYKILRENKVNIIKLTPAHLALLKDRDNKDSSVKRFIVGGENLKVSLAASVFESFGKEIDILNEYGPTETVVGCMIHKYDYHGDKGNSVPIGTPADNVQVYILDDALNIVPYGKIGELYISGHGVARGYLNNEKLTNERFIKNPFVADQVMYKTGDTAIYRKDGTIEYIGRKDNQVKIRGHRIELMEIENRLLEIPKVKEAVVVDKEDINGDRKLHAYIISAESITPQEIKKYLSMGLPNYMIPASFTFIDKVPLTQNGKVDKRLLPEPSNLKQSRVNIIGPRDERERKLINIIKEVLSIEEVSISDSFYELGGDSIKAIQVVNKLNNSGINLKVKDILSSSTIGDIAEAFTFEEIGHASQEFSEGVVENTPIMSWFLEQGFKNINHWNQSVLLKINNSITKQMLEKAISDLVKHHDSLRINFNQSTGVFYYNSAHINKLHNIEEFDLSNLTVKEQKSKLKEIGEKFKSSFDLREDVLFKACIFILGKGERRLLLTAHHLVVDGVSWRIILEDLNNLLKGSLDGTSYELPQKTHTVQEFVKELEKYSKGQALEELSYWKELLENKTSYPKDYDEEEYSIEYLSTIKGVLSDQETERILNEANRAYGTETNELLIIALVLTLSKYTEGNKVVIELEGHGREEISNKINITRTVGWFTSMYPAVFNMEGEDLDKKIKALKEQIRHIPNKGFNFGVLRYINKALNETENRYIRFNYLGDFGSTFKNAIFENAYEETGLEYGRENHMTSLMEILSIIEGDRLSFSISFSRKVFKEETISSLLQEYLLNLSKIIEYCCEKQSKEFTPSDFDVAEISQEDLDSLFD